MREQTVYRNSNVATRRLHLLHNSLLITCQQSLRLPTTAARGKSKSKLFTLKWFYFNIGTKERPPSLVLRETKTGLGAAARYRVYRGTEVPQLTLYLSLRTQNNQNTREVRLKMCLVSFTGFLISYVGPKTGYKEWGMIRTQLGTHNR
jgi:hypothetical protein